MTISLFLLALASPPDLIVDIVDSRDNPRITFIIINNCRVAVDKAELRDYDRVVKKVEEICQIQSK